MEKIDLSKESEKDSAKRKQRYIDLINKDLEKLGIPFVLGPNASSKEIDDANEKIKAVKGEKFKAGLPAREAKHEEYKKKQDEERKRILKKLGMPETTPPSLKLEEMIDKVQREEAAEMLGLPLDSTWEEIGKVQSYKEDDEERKKAAEALGLPPDSTWVKIDDVIVRNQLEKAGYKFPIGGGTQQ